MTSTLSGSLPWILAATFTVTACGTPPEIERRIAALEGANAQLSSKVALAESKLLELRLDLQADEEALLDPTEKGYAAVKSNNGYLFVATDDVSPYGDGQRVTLRVGNPHNVTFNGLKITARYGPRSPDMPNFSDAEAVKKWSAAQDKWRAALRQKELSLTDELHPGRWNRVSMILAPAKVEDVGFIGIKIRTHQVSLLRRQ